MSDNANAAKTDASKIDAPQAPKQDNKPQSGPQEVKKDAPAAEAKSN